MMPLGHILKHISVKYIRLQISINTVLIGYATPFQICHTISDMPHHPLYYGSVNRINYLLVYLKWCGISEMVWHNR